MRGIRHRKMLITTLLILSLFMLFHTTLDTERKSLTQIDDAKRVKKKKDDDTNTPDVNNTPTVHDNTIHLQPNPIDTTYTYDENIMINEKDVLYMAVYMDVFYIEFLGEKEKIYSLESKADLQEFHAQIEQKRLIWIHVIQNIKVYNKSLGTSADIQRLINYIVRKKCKHIVIDPIVNTKYNLYIDPVYKPGWHLKRLRKLDLVWWHVLTEHAYGYSLILYTPASMYRQAILFVEKRPTLVSVTFDVFLGESVNFRKSFMVLGLKDGNEKERISSNIGFIEVFSMLSHRVNQFLLDKIKNGKYPFLKMDKILRQEYNESIENGQVHKKQPILQSIYINSTAPKIDPGIKSIHFINAGFQKTNMKDIHFEALLAISHPQVAKIYFNILNQKIGYNKYWITRYSPLYVDFSYCVLNALYEECFNEFFHQTEYLLIRDIDCKRLDLLLAYKLYAKFPYINEVPVDGDGLLEVSSKPLRVHIKNEKLKEFFPKMAMKNMVYCYTEHMLFMRSTLRVEAHSEHPKHKIFDVLIFKNPLKKYITIKTEKKTKSENKTEEKTEEKEIQGVEDLPNITKVINKLNRSKNNLSQSIVVLNYSLITEEKLKEIIDVNEKKFALQKISVYNLCIRKVKVSSSSTTKKKGLKRMNNSSSNNQTKKSARKLNTSLDSGVDNEQAISEDIAYSCNMSLECVSNFSTIQNIDDSSLHSYLNAANQPEDNTYEQQEYTQYFNMQFIDKQCEKEQETHIQTQCNPSHDSSQNESTQVASINYAYTDSQHTNNSIGLADSFDLSVGEHIEIDTMSDAYEYNILNSIWNTNI
ncbi:hypothetical protein NEFER03_0651 [Nematocida sp. LUAm3]|nr:hypothetical protein NEFER03_0651 [Nematocida sp. LUAm3]